MAGNSSQMKTGKAFEYALSLELFEKLRDKTNICLVENNSLAIAKSCFQSLPATEQSRYRLTASFTVNFLMDIEPRLSHDLGENDLLEVEIAADNRGIKGDVRDLLIIRKLQSWEIGLSAKNNHNAVKHSRLSPKIDFGKKWIGIPVSDEYFNSVNLIFGMLQEERRHNANKTWHELGDIHTAIYLPVLKAFKKELARINSNNPQTTATNLVKYLIGVQDFYKIIQRPNEVEIIAYNLRGTLNLPHKDIQPKFTTPRVKLPTKITNIKLKDNSSTTVEVTCDHGWKLSFRIHSASSRIEPSLKFDVQLLESPNTLFKNTLSIQVRSQP